MTIAGTTRPPPLLLSRLEKQLSPPRRRQHSPLKSSPSHRYNFDDGTTGVEGRVDVGLVARLVARLLQRLPQRLPGRLDERAARAA